MVLAKTSVHRQKEGREAVEVQGDVFLYQRTRTSRPLRELEKYIDEEEADYECWAVQEEETAEELIRNQLWKDVAVSPPKLPIEKIDLLRKNGTRHKGMKAISRLILQAYCSLKGKATYGISCKLANYKQKKKKQPRVYKKEGDNVRVSKKSAESVNSAKKNINTIASGFKTAGATVFEDEVVKKMGLMVDFVNTSKILSIHLKSSASTTKNQREGGSEYQERFEPCGGAPRAGLCCIPVDSDGFLAYRLLRTRSTP